MSDALKWGCHCDLGPGDEPGGCVIDEDRRVDCTYASRLKRKEDCQYWRQYAPDEALTAARAAVVEAGEKLFDAGISRIPGAALIVAAPVDEMDNFRDAVRNLRRLRELEEK